MKGKKSVRFWGSNVLEGIGITAGAAAILLLFFGMGGMRGAGDMTDLLLAAAGLYPWYLLIVGVFISLILSVGYFQTYYSVLLSMNVTRKAIVRGIFLCMAATMAGILLLAGLIWYLIPGDISEDARVMLPQIAGGYLILGSIFLVLGAVVLRFGKIGTLIMAAVLMLTGMLAGIFAALSGRGIVAQLMERLQKLVNTGNSSLAMILAGVLLYLASGALAALLTRKQEVRV